VCTTCGSVPRQRAIVTVLSLVRPDWPLQRTWELAPAGPASDRLRRECAQYMGSHYWPDVPPGTLVDGVRCEDLEHPTLVDGSIDIIVSSDVFEHIIDVDAAHAQIARVLSEGGVHIWTTPQNRGLEVSSPRVRRTPDGLVFLEPAIYHGDPVNADGALVTFDWGADLPDRVMAASGLRTTVIRLESRTHGLLGEYLEVFVSHRAAFDEPILFLEPLRQIKLETAALRDELTVLGAEIAGRDARLAAIEGSRSWRITRPLRAAAMAIRGRDG
jgi:hypothetical protein